MTINLSLILQTTRIQKQFPLSVFVFIDSLVVSALQEASGYAISRITMHSSIIIFACFIYFKNLSVFSLWLFRTFLYSLSWNGAMFQTVLTFELPKLTFSCCDGCGFTSRSLQIGTISFIMFCNILILMCENMERLSRNVQLFSSFRNFQAIFAPSNSYFTEYSRWVPPSFVNYDSRFQ